MSKHDEVPPPPDIVAAIRAQHGLPARTATDELHIQFEARVRANGGKLVALTQADLTVASAITTIGQHIARDCAGCPECESALTTLKANLNQPSLRGARAALVASLGSRPVPTTRTAAAAGDDDVPPPPQLSDLLRASKRK